MPFDFQCEFCGRTRTVSRRAYIGRFCSVSCSNLSRYKNKTTHNESGKCIFQPDSILCEDLACEKCGWNPDVAKARLETIGVHKGEE